MEKVCWVYNRLLYFFKLCVFIHMLYKFYFIIYNLLFVLNNLCFQNNDWSSFRNKNLVNSLTINGFFKWSKGNIIIILLYSLRRLLFYCARFFNRGEFKMSDDECSLITSQGWLFLRKGNILKFPKTKLIIFFQEIWTFGSQSWDEHFSTLLSSCQRLRLMSCSNFIWERLWKLQAYN